MIKKGNKRELANYRCIHLLYTKVKFVTKVITNEINSITTPEDEQQGFRSEQSCVVLRQLIKESIEYNKPTFLRFIDFTKVFDRSKLEDVVHLLYK